MDSQNSTEKYNIKNPEVKQRKIVAVVALFIVFLLVGYSAGYIINQINSSQNDFCITDDDCAEKESCNGPYASEYYCYCEGFKCEESRRGDTEFGRISIDSVWNSSGKISFMIKNSGTYTYTDADVEAINVYVAGVPVIKSKISQCKDNIRELGGTCQIDTDADFPNALGNEAGVKIEVKPPFDQGDIYLCKLYDLEPNKYC